MKTLPEMILEHNNKLVFVVSFIVAISVKSSHVEEMVAVGVITPAVRRMIVHSPTSRYN